MPADRIETGSELWYAHRRTSYHGTDSVAEIRYVPSHRFNFIVGVEGIYDRESLREPDRIVRQTEELFPASDNARQFDFLNLGVYASSNVAIVERLLKLTGGLRYDNHSTYGSQVTGRFGGVGTSVGAVKSRRMGTVVDVGDV